MRERPAQLTAAQIDEGAGGGYRYYRDDREEAEGSFLQSFSEFI
jgi:hypothetical protein